MKRTKEEIDLIKKRNIRLGRFAVCPVNAWKTRGMAKEGEVRIWNRDGVKVAFVKIENVFIPRNRWLWESEKGKLDRNDIIRALPGAPVMAELHHLEKISMPENAIRNKKLPRSIIKTMFKIKDNELAQQIADDYPEIIELKLKMLNLNAKLNGRN